jgi:hypothetical protein
MTGLWAFETQLPYQKYQGPPIVVRWLSSLSIRWMGDSWGQVASFKEEGFVTPEG